MVKSIFFMVFSLWDKWLLFLQHTFPLVPLLVAS